MLRTRMTTLAGLVGEGDGGSGWGLGETFVFFKKPFLVCLLILSRSGLGLLSVPFQTFLQ